MSYSFQVKAKTKTDAILAAEAAFKEKVLIPQPIHSRDEAAAFKNLREHVALSREPHSDEELVVDMHGSIWVENDEVKACGSGCTVSVMKA